MNFGRIVWEATGGDPSQFPIRTALSGVDDTGLRFLLDEAPSDDPEFWRSVGRLVTLERLLLLGVRSRRIWLRLFTRTQTGSWLGTCS